MIHVAKIGETFIDYPNPEDIAVIVFTEGCSHNCEGCHSPSLQSQLKDDEVCQQDFVKYIVDRCKRNNTNKIVFSGGDPYYHEGSNDQMIDIMRTISYLENNNYNCCVYTGYDINSIINLYNQYGVGLVGPTYIKCGEYHYNEKEKEWGKTDEIFTLVSRNQYFMKKIKNPLEYEKCSEHNKYRF